MNRKRLISFLVATSFLMGQGVSAKASDELEVTHLDAPLEANIDGSFGFLASAPQSSGETLSMDTSDISLPDSFDLREKNLVSSVKNQGSSAICWAVTATSVMETELITENPNIDLSEWQLAYYTYSRKFGFPLPETSPDPEDAFSIGGNYFLLNAMLLNWISPALESDYPFGKTELLDPDLDADAVRQQSAYHMKNSYFIEYEPDSDNFENQLRQIKEIVYDGHAVALNYYNATSNYSNVKGNQNFYNASGVLKGGVYHAVTVVGWDDNYSADNFKVAPDRDGAWLCKNSWGEGWGNDGYFWISYAEKSCIQPYYLEMEEKNLHHQQFYHDNYGWNSSVSTSARSTSSYMANIFTAEEDTLLTSARFATGMENESYEVQVYTNLRSKSRPTSGTSSAGIAKGKTSLCGYYTVDLEKPVRIPAGETFSIVVKLSGSVGRHMTCESYVATTTEFSDGTGSFTKNIEKEQLMEGFAPNQSFYSSNGTTWSDVYDASAIEENYTATTDSGTATVSTETILGNVCVRGLTQLMGDVNLDGAVNASDATEVLIYSAKLGSGEIPENDIQWTSRADMNNNGSLNADDAAYILQIAASLGAGEQ